MADSFWDIDHVLAEQQKIPCFVALDVPGYGFLDGNSSENLCKNTRIELPFWMVTPLIAAEQVELEYPHCFARRALDDVATSAVSVNLNGLSPFFFLFGVKFVNLIEDANLGNVLADAFSQRIAEIMQYSQSGRSYSKFISTLDDTEKQIFKTGQESFSKIQRWANGHCSGDKIQTAQVLQRALIKK
ncbi:hypothetical protein BJ741DRAFT_613353 [Chytriomyces cf. hyalinus JEL632]|nr:hypothetical protein BJ741DRAFT_613353 [Chytriomyces cf. hyalinus JEL632]